MNSSRKRRQASAGVGAATAQVIGKRRKQTNSQSASNVTASTPATCIPVGPVAFSQRAPSPVNIFDRGEDVGEQEGEISNAEEEDLLAIIKETRDRSKGLEDTLREIRSLLVGQGCKITALEQKVGVLEGSLQAVLRQRGAVPTTTAEAENEEELKRRKVQIAKQALTVLYSPQYPFTPLRSELMLILPNLSDEYRRLSTSEKPSELNAAEELRAHTHRVIGKEKVRIAKIVKGQSTYCGREKISFDEFHKSFHCYKTLSSYSIPPSEHEQFRALTKSKLAFLVCVYRGLLRGRKDISFWPTVDDIYRDICQNHPKSSLEVFVVTASTAESVSDVTWPAMFESLSSVLRVTSELAISGHAAVEGEHKVQDVPSGVSEAPKVTDHPHQSL
eukprot:CAMPEP_0119152258 /NCGR_PEP_ID=MMETSP1310-20130426/47499_1 /TAXON_ID=464262 /ORGANISM="Genus nov. species nov., Strain RCC2339" /LENGTH=388 /DNA_ID=CAMNT_0007144603 /DNA_START=21 /DNA_END=1187 /DNA_ORIENTATION=+